MKRYVLTLLVCLPWCGWTADVRAEDSVKPAVNKRFNQDDAETPSFRRHVLPLLGRLGCNGRACHGSFQGQGGFKLSLFGYDFDADFQALHGPKDKERIEGKDPVASLLLKKPTRQVPHKGGKLFTAGDWSHRLLSAWIKAGTPRDDADGPGLKRLEMIPKDVHFTKEGDKAKLRIVAHWSDGVSEDVTPLCRFRSNNEGLVQVDEFGEITAMGKGATHVVVFYDNEVVPVPVLTPVSDLIGERYPKTEPGTKIDLLLLHQHRKLGLVTSELCGDLEFLRRVSLDLAGTLPTPQEVAAFQADARPDKRARKVEELLATPAYAAWWSTKMLDVMGNHNQIGFNNPYRIRLHIFCRMWFEWMSQRLSDNMPYDQLVERIVLANSRLPGQSYEGFCKEMCAMLASGKIADIRSRPSVPFYWEAHNPNKTEERVLQFAHAFLGLSVQCAQCHKHPFDQWRKEDFEHFKGFFSRINRGYMDEKALASAKQMNAALKLSGSGNARLRLEEKLLQEGQLLPLWETFSSKKGFQKGGSKEVFAARPKNSQKTFSLRVLAGAKIADDIDDPRVPLMQWLKSAENPYFARAFVNRVWASYFHVGLVDPPDDLNLANPASNEDVLDFLSKGFVQNGYDMKWVHRQIALSQAYQRSYKPNATNKLDERQFSRFVLRQLPAEVLYDAIEQATAHRPAGAKADSKDRAICSVPQSFGIGAGTGRNYALKLFGKPKRVLTCDCERSSEPTLLQSLYLQNDPDILLLIKRQDGWVTQLDTRTPTKDLIREAYARTMCRQPSDAELKRCERFLVEASNVRDGVRDLLLALINTREFITNH